MRTYKKMKAQLISVADQIDEILSGRELAYAGAGSSNVYLSEINGDSLTDAQIKDLNDQLAMSGGNLSNFSLLRDS